MLEGGYVKRSECKHKQHTQRNMKHSEVPLVYEYFFFQTLTSEIISAQL
jgi:hypothetical protein